MSLAALLASQARRSPDRVLLRTATGDLGYAEAHLQAGRHAAALAAHGVRTGEPVAVLMRNGTGAVLTWFGVARLGAIHVPLNTALIGAGLVHALRVSGARVAVADAASLPPLMDVIDDLDLTVLVHGGEVPPGPRFAAFVPADGPPVPEPAPDDLDTAMMLFTSGTTGVSKACELSHRYVVRQAALHAENLGFTGDDVLYCPFPLFHLDATTLTVVAAMTVGATAAIGARFSASGFWDEVRRFDATVINFMGATLTILWKRPPSRDRDHRVRLAWGVPMPEWKAGWEERFGVPLVEVYGLTDGGVVAYDPLGVPKRPGSCGRVIPEYEVAIGDPDGDLLPPGTTGEILIRPREPGLVMNGYRGMPEATAEAFRDGRLRTGDLGRLDEDGHLYFVGRAKDAIRRRGENISAFEVEQTVESHPSVLEAAAFGVPSELTEEDVKVCVVLRPGAELTARELLAHCAATSAAHMVPRYVEFLDALPKTPTQKVEKFRLRQPGVTPGTYDAESPEAATPWPG
ncbi:AMP-binding protein [Spirillospora sp. CA-294931]|uniref:AMP-binding protein n=1 Tax=Spirillospora sp. CA-294931 TaxID=3240042 RepID=UPI003D93509A